MGSAHLQTWMPAHHEENSKDGHRVHMCEGKSPSLMRELRRKEDGGTRRERAVGEASAAQAGAAQLARRVRQIWKVEAE